MFGYIGFYNFTVSFNGSGDSQKITLVGANQPDNLVLVDNNIQITSSYYWGEIYYIVGNRRGLDYTVGWN
jgi:hypothetical protein